MSMMVCQAQFALICIVYPDKSSESRKSVAYQIYVTLKCI